jgi:hypothetical protein
MLHFFGTLVEQNLGTGDEAEGVGETQVSEEK